MPRIPSLTAPQVGESALPGPLQSQSIAGNIAGAGNAIAAGVGEFGRRVEARKAQANGIAVRSVDRQARAERLRLRQNAEGTGYDQVADADVVARAAEMRAGFLAHTTALLDGLTPAQREMALAAIEDQRLAFEDDLNVREGLAWNRIAAQDYDDETNSLVLGAAEDARSTVLASEDGIETTRADAARASLDATIEQFAAENPHLLDDDAAVWIEAEKARQRTALHLGVIDQLLEGGDAETAEQYLEKYRGDLEPGARGKAEAKIQRTGFAAIASQTVDAVLDEHPILLGADAIEEAGEDYVPPAQQRATALAEARARLEAAGVSEEAKQTGLVDAARRFDARLASEKAIQAEAFETLSLQASLIPDLAQLTAQNPTEWGMLSPAQQISLTQSIAADATSADRAEASAGILRMIADDPDGFVGWDGLRLMEPFLEPSDYAMFSKMQSEAREGRSKLLDDGVSWATRTKAAAADVLSLKGEEANGFLQASTLALSNEQIRLGRELAPTEQDALLNRLTAEAVRAESGRVVEFDGGRRLFNATPADIDADEITDEDYARLRLELWQSGNPYDDEAVKLAYVKELRGLGGLTRASVPRTGAPPADIGLRPGEIAAVQRDAQAAARAASPEGRAFSASQERMLTGRAGWYQIPAAEAARRRMSGEMDAPYDGPWELTEEGRRGMEEAARRARETEAQARLRTLWDLVGSGDRR